MNKRSSAKVVLVGSFAPFHDGHKNIVERALDIFDMVVIGVSVNNKKNYATTVEERVETIRKIYENNERVVVEANHGLTIDFALAHQAKCIIKGLRNVEDFVSEREQAHWNKRNGGIDTLLFFADESFENLSSTSIREKCIEKGENDKL